MRHPFFLIFLILSACVSLPQKPAPLQAELLPPPPDVTQLSSLLGDSKQMLLVVSPGIGATEAALYMLQRQGEEWRLVRSPMGAVVGRNGMAPLWEKREGDGRTPSGIYPLPFTYGYAPATTSAMPYRQATDDDLWVDDVNSPDYNRWVKRGETSATTFETMKLSDDRYKYGIVIGYNMDPIIRGNGSAIFLHLWKDKGPTAGCVAIAEDDMLALLDWLDPKQKPMIVLATAESLNEFPVRLATIVPSGSPCATANRIEEVTKKYVEVARPSGFRGAAFDLPESLREEMVRKKTWREGCPVAMDDLAYIVMAYRGFDGDRRMGEMVMHRRLASNVLDLFADLYDSGFPIQRMELIEKYDGNDDRSMEANNTSAFNCRNVTGRPGVLSRHSYGTAIDINPLQNPYLIPSKQRLSDMGWDGKGERSDYLKRAGFAESEPLLDFCRKDEGNCTVYPPKAAEFLDRSMAATGLFRDGDAAVAVFEGKGFQWGGRWKNVLDYQHFEFQLK